MHCSWFQSTHPRGVRPTGIGRITPIFCVSIHAPTWGATFGNGGFGWGNRGFNPRTHVGCDGGRAQVARNPTGFNPRTHVGCDKPCRRRVAPPRGFNPRTHVGCDVPGLLHARQDGRFNPRTHVGCDVDVLPLVDNPLFVSIHAPTWGATFFSSFQSPVFAVSIHAPTWGATSSLSRGVTATLFQSTHPRGVRHKKGEIQSSL